MSIPVCKIDLTDDNNEAKTLRCTIYTYNPNPKRTNDLHDFKGFYERTVDELADECCVYLQRLYFKASLPKEELRWVDEMSATPYDIYNYECYEWYDGDRQTKRIIQDEVDRINARRQLIEAQWQK